MENGKNGNKGKHWREVYKSDYLASWDIDRGKSLILTIKECKEEKAKLMVKRDESDIKVIAYFEEDVKPMVVNITNCKIMHDLTGGGHFNEWAGLKIEVYPEPKGDTYGLSIKKKFPKVFTDNTKALSALRECASLLDLQSAYMKLDKYEKADKEVVALKNELKTELQ